MPKTGLCTRPFWKITLAVPELVPVCRRLLEDEGVRMPAPAEEEEEEEDIKCRLSTFESNVLFVLRFIVEKQLSGTSWLRLKRGTYWLDAEENRRTRTQIEVHQHWTDLFVEPLEGQWSGVDPLDP